MALKYKLCDLYDLSHYSPTIPHWRHTIMCRGGHNNITPLLSVPRSRCKELFRVAPFYNKPFVENIVYIYIYNIIYSVDTYLVSGRMRSPFLVIRSITSSYASTIFPFNMLAVDTLKLFFGVWIESSTTPTNYPLSYDIIILLFTMIL